MLVNSKPVHCKKGWVGGSILKFPFAGAVFCDVTACFRLREPSRYIVRRLLVSRFRASKLRNSAVNEVYVVLINYS